MCAQKCPHLIFPPKWANSLRANRDLLRANRGLLRANRGLLRANRGLLRANRGLLRANRGLLRANRSNPKRVKTAISGTEMPPKTQN